MIVQTLLNGLFLASAYAVIALGLTITVGVMKIVNFAHGQMYVLGGITSHYLMTAYGVPAIVAIAASACILFAVGVVTERCLFQPVVSRSEREENIFLLAAGFALLLESLMFLFFGERQRSTGPYVAGVFNIDNIYIPYSRITIFVLSSLTIVSVLAILKWSKWGRALRAVSLDDDAAQMQGINTTTVKAVGFGIGSMLAGLSGALLVSVFTMNPGGGSAISIKAFLMIMIGGAGSVPGSLLGAAVIGMAEAFGYSYLPGSLNILIVYCALIVLMFFKPAGLIRE